MACWPSWCRQAERTSPRRRGENGAGPNALDAIAAKRERGHHTRVCAWHMLMSPGHSALEGKMLAMAEWHVKLFKNGRNQALRIPRELELPGNDAILPQAGQRLII